MLAITKMHGGVCTAGIDGSGTWIRPIRRPSTQDREQTGITDYSLLPVDFFHGGRSHLVNLGMTRFQLVEPLSDPPHVEDWIMDSGRKPQLVRKLSGAEQADYLSRYVETDLRGLELHRSRSLSLIKPTSFSFAFRPNQTGDDVTVRAWFSFSGKDFNNIGCTDLRMRALGRTLLEKSDGEPVDLTEEDFKRRGKDLTYLAVGLSRLYLGRNWLIVVGVHTIPELDVAIDYARL